MPPITRMIAEAAQKYGFIVNDQTGATVGFRAEDPMPLIREGQPNPPFLSTSGETLTIEESMTLRARTENAGHAGDEHERSWSSSSG